MQTLRRRTRAAQLQGKPRHESISAAVYHLKQQGLSAADIRRWLDKLQIEPVFTAHPSEAKRRTTRQLLRRIRSHLPKLQSPDVHTAEQDLLADLTVLWQTDLVRPERPPVMSEVGRGLFFCAALWRVVPEIYRELRGALAGAFPQHHFEIPTFLSFGTWIGGDRDGHPFVTAETTRQTLAMLRQSAVDNHLGYCRDMIQQIVMSDQQIPSGSSLKETVEARAADWPELAQRLESVSRFETCRRFLTLMEYRLEATRDDASNGHEHPASYSSIHEFASDLGALQQSIRAHRGQRVADEIIQPWIDLAQTFGLHFAALDIRQNSARHRSCVAELLTPSQQASPPTSDAELSCALAEVAPPVEASFDRLTPESQEVVETMLQIAQTVRRWGTRPFGGYIISMTHSALDVRALLWLWKTAWRTSQGAAELPYLPIIPLFETISDLRRAPGIMQELLADPDYHQYLFQRGGARQTVMVGYSDSTKDGGYLAACWELHQAQQRLAEIADQHHIELTVFHGRGGALGRGGGPAARAIRSLPPRAVDGRLRVTEQGEVLAERYDDPRIAHRHLEQLIEATLMVSVQSDVEQNAEWVSAMTRMADLSLHKYRELVEHPGFLDYFAEATPIGEIETLPIGSRPARRGARTSLSDLRAIPWTFAWTQSRHFLPAWYGFGTAVCGIVDDRDQDWSLLQAMYRDWPMFRALVDNAELALAKADMEIAHLYARLTPGQSSEEIWQLIRNEFQASRAAVLVISEHHDLLSAVDWLSRSIQKRNPYVDPLNLVQVELLRRQRSNDAAPQLTDLLRLTIQGVASGLRTTG